MKRVKKQKKTRCGHKYFQQTKKVITRRRALQLARLKKLRLRSDKLFASQFNN